MVGSVVTNTKRTVGKPLPGEVLNITLYHTWEHRGWLAVAQNQSTQPRGRDASRELNYVEFTKVDFDSVEKGRRSGHESRQASRS
jgi:hypothetical protein